MILIFAAIEQAAAIISNPRQFVEANIGEIRKRVRSLCRKYSIFGDDSTEFESEIIVMLLENDCKHLRGFKGSNGCSAQTYLFTLIGSRFIDAFRKIVEKKWHPSTRAEELGPLAKKLEELLIRFGLPFHEAYETLVSNPAMKISEEAARALSHQLMDRNMPARFTDELPDVHDPGDSPEDSAIKAQLLELKRQLLDLVREISRDLSPEDRLMIKMAYEDGINISEIGRQLKVDNPHYRIKKVIERFQTELLRRGINYKSAIGLLEEYDV